MLKPIIAAVTAVSCFISALPCIASANGGDIRPETSKFQYTQDGNNINVSLDSAIQTNGEASNAFIAVYDGEKLISAAKKELPAGMDSIKLSDFTITLPDGANVTEVKAFLWSADSKCTPLSDASIIGSPADINNKSISFNANMLSEDYSYYISMHQIPVLQSPYSPQIITYNIKNDTEMYVNGVNAGIVSKELIENYIIDNPTGTVTLVDTPEAGAADTDGIYDRIMVELYADAVVDSVQTTDEYARIYFKAHDMLVPSNRMQWDLNDDNVDINFTLDGKEIDYTGLQENDVLSIQFDIVNENSLIDLTYYNVKVSRNTVSGTVTSRNGNMNTVRIDGIDYPVIPLYDVNYDTELATPYTLYLDVFGYAAYLDELPVPKNYGIITAMYMEAGNDCPTVRMITSDGKEVSYECKDNEEAREFYRTATGNYNYSGTISVSQSSIQDRILNGETVCSFKLSNGQLRFDKDFISYGGTDMEYKSASNKFAIYTVSDSHTKILDLSGYMSGESSVVNTVSISDLKDEALYHVYLYDRNADGEYRFAIIFDGELDLPEYNPEEDESYIEEGIGMVMGIHSNLSPHKPTVRLINEAGEIVLYECADDETAEQFLALAGIINVNENISQEKILSGETICAYTIRNNRISLLTQPLLSETADAEHIIYIGDYFNSGFVYNIDLSKLTGEYTAYTVSDGDGNAKVSFITAGDAELSEYQQPLAQNEPGVIISMYQTYNADYPSVLMLTAAGQIVQYKCNSYEDANKFFAAATGIQNGSYKAFSKTDNRERLCNGETMCTYSADYTGKATFGEAIPVKCQDMIYNSADKTLGGYSIEELTLVAIDGYISGNTKHADILTETAFEDGGVYYGVIADSNNDGKPDICILSSSIYVMQKTAPIAIVSRILRTTSIDGTVCTELEISYDDQEEISLLVEGDNHNISEGSVITYKVGPNGYVEDGHLFTIYCPESNYYDTLTEAVTNNSKALWHMNSSESDYVTPSYGIPGTKDVRFYYGVVYQNRANNLELITNSSGMVSDIYSDVESFNTSHANRYTYDYSQQPKYRVSVGSISQSSTIFNQSYVDDNKSIISWDSVAAEDVAPATALIKIVDGDVTDIIYYVS